MAFIEPLIVVTPPPIFKSSSLRLELSKKFINLVFNQENRYLKENELIELCQGAQGLLVGRDLITEKVLSSLPNLKIISKYGVGLDNLDQDLLKLYKVKLGWTPGVNKRSVAELTLGFMLGLIHNIFKAGYSLKHSRWKKDGGNVLQGKNVGIIGCGNIGKEVINLLHPFGCNVLVHDILKMTEYCQKVGASEVGLDRLLGESDIISLHVPLTPETKNMINKETFEKMKISAFLINTSRGDVVNESDLKFALLKNKIAGAALDVFSIEPPEDRELLACPSLMVTPHIGGNSLEAVELMGQSAINHLVDYFGK